MEAPFLMTTGPVVVAVEQAAIQPQVGQEERIILPMVVCEVLLVMEEVAVEVALVTTAPPVAGQVAV
jgi:hypothetical protein